MTVRILESAPFGADVSAVIAVDDALRCDVCGRRPAGVGSSEALARASLARMGRCHHGRWYLKALWRLGRWWRARRAE
jgi:hypothetical protein